MTTSLLAAPTRPSVEAPVRVLFLSHSGRMYGAQRQLLDLVEGTRALGVVPIVGVPEGGPLTEALARVGVATLRVPARKWTGLGYRFARRYLQTRLGVGAFAREIGRVGVDVIHSNSSLSALGAMTARRLGLPHVWHFHEVRADWLRPQSKVERTLVSHTVASTSGHVVVPSHELAHRIVPYVPPSLVRVVPNGLLRREDRRRLKPLRATGPLRLLTVGRAKDWNTSIDVLEGLVRGGRDARLTFVGGEKNLVPAHRAYATGLGLANRVRFVEPVDDPRPFYEAADVLIHPSAYESFGRVLVEAMAVGLPVVAHRTGGIPEIVEDGRTGRLVDLGDVPAMTAAVAATLDDPVRTERMRGAAWDDVWTRFTLEPFAASFADLYRAYVV